MTIYGDTALAVVSAYDNINKPDPRECWEHSITYFTESKESQKKGCPKSAFLGLCEEGYVDGIPKGTYLFSESPNKLYATTAAELLLAEPNKKYSKSGLWKKATEHCDSAARNQNGQMDVVLALKEAGLLKKPN